jgi:chemotaxis protein MotB
MRVRIAQSPANSRERWAISYVDVLSLLVIFFMVASLKNLPIQPAKASTKAPPPVTQAKPAEPVKPAEAEQPAASAEPSQTEESAPTAENSEAESTTPAQPVPPPRASLFLAQERLISHGLEPKLEPRGLVISVPQVILFSSGQDTVNPAALPTLARIADVLKDIPNHVRLIGHADTVPVHNHRFRSNWDLSLARSEKILELLSAKYGIAESRLSIASYGPWRPAASNETADGRAYNRRVEIVILDDSGSADDEQE